MSPPSSTVRKSNVVTLPQLSRVRKTNGATISSPRSNRVLLPVVTVSRKSQEAPTFIPRPPTQPAKAKSPVRQPSKCKLLPSVRRNTKTTSIIKQTFEEAAQEFHAAYPELEETSHIGAMRATEFGRLDADGHVYLDYTGGGLHGESQLKEHFELLSKATFGNPHSSNPTSAAMTKLVEESRSHVLRFFNADPAEYDCIFTANCSGALRIVGESYPFQPGSHYLLPSDNHNSVQGIREFAKVKGAAVTYVHVQVPNLRLDGDEVSTLLHTLDTPGAPKLFAFAAQSNFSGVQHSLDLIEEAHDAGWDVLLDAAAYAPTNRIDLSKIKPDFMPLSFYKIFGYPTGMGALIVRRTAMAKLATRPWFAGGTVEVALVGAQKHWLHKDHAAFEDGTINYLNIPAVSIGLRFIERCGIDNIHNRVMAMTSWLLEQLLMLTHKNGSRMVSVYGPHTSIKRGGTVTLNVFDPEGAWVTCWAVEALANQRNISLRAGCFCNPGASEDAFQWGNIPEKVEQIQTMSKANFSKSVPVAGAVRISVGVPTNFKDIFTCVEFFTSMLDKQAAQVQAAAAAVAAGPLGPH